MIPYFTDPVELSSLGLKSPRWDRLSPLFSQLDFSTCISESPWAEQSYVSKKRTTLLQEALAWYQAQQRPFAFKGKALGSMPFPKGWQCHRGPWIASATNMSFGVTLHTVHEVILDLSGVHILVKHFQFYITVRLFYCYLCRIYYCIYLVSISKSLLRVSALIGVPSPS